MRGLWLKIWIAAESLATPRSTAFVSPPALETWAPISTARKLSGLRRRAAGP